MSPEVRRRRRGRWWRRLRRASRQRPTLAVLGVLVAVVLVAICWTGFRTWTIARNLDRVAAEAQVFRSALIRGDARGAGAALDGYQQAADRAAAQTSGPSWWIARHLPLLGNDAAAARSVSAVLADLGRDGLAPLVETADQVSANAFLPTDHRFPLDQIAALQKPAAASSAAFDRAARRLGGIRQTGLIGPVHGQLTRLRALVTSARSALRPAYTASRLMPIMLGADGPRDYLIVLQNNAEIRATGGLPGSVSLVHAEDGRVRIVDQVDMHDLGFATAPVLPLTSAERNLYGDDLGTVSVDSTLTPDSARASSLVKAWWEKAGHPKVDGVFFIDPVAVSGLLQGVGAVPVPGYPDVTAANVVEAVENMIYIATTDGRVQSDYQNAVAKGVFNAFVDGRGDSVGAIRGLVSGVIEGRVRMHFFGKTEQRWITGTAIAGELPSRPDSHPQVGIYINDSTEAKMSYYLQYDASVVARVCVGSVQELSGSVTLTNAAPDNVASLPESLTGVADPERGIVRGQQLLVVYLWSPLGGEITGVSVDGTPYSTVSTVPVGERAVAPIAVRLAPQATHAITFTMRSGRGQVGSARLAVTPSATAPGLSGSVRSAC